MSDRFNLIIDDDIDVDEDYIYEDNDNEVGGEDNEGYDNNDMEIINEDKYENEEDQENEESEDTKTYKKRSWVWEYFSYDDNVKKGKCSLCKAYIACNKGSTTGMSNHLKSRHRITKNGGKEKQNQLTLEESFKNSNQIIVSLI